MTCCKCLGAAKSAGRVEVGYGRARYDESIASVGRKKSCSVQTRVAIRESCLHNPPLEHVHKKDWAQLNSPPWQFQFQPRYSTFYTNSYFLFQYSLAE